MACGLGVPLPHLFLCAGHSRQCQEGAGTGGDDTQRVEQGCFGSLVQSCCSPSSAWQGFAQLPAAVPLVNPQLPVQPLSCLCSELLYPPSPSWALCLDKPLCEPVSATASSSQTLNGSYMTCPC